MRPSSEPLSCDAPLQHRRRLPKNVRWPGRRPNLCPRHLAGALLDLRADDPRIRVRRIPFSQAGAFRERLLRRLQPDPYERHTSRGGDLLDRRAI